MESAWSDAGRDQALLLDGVNDYGTLGIAGFPKGTHEQTLSLWFRQSQAYPLGCLLSIRRDNESGIALLVEDGIVSARQILGTKPPITAPQAVANGKWHHVAYVFRAETHQLFIDGLEVGTSTASPPNRTPTAAWLGSADGHSQFYQGELDEVRVRALASSANWVAAAAGGNAPDEDEVVAHYSFDESGGATVRDRSGHQNHLILGDGIPDTSPQRVIGTRTPP